MAPKFNFIPARQIKPEVKEYVVSINVTPTRSEGNVYMQHYLTISKKTVDTYQLGGKFLRLYADLEKKTIGWSILTDEETLANLSDVILIKPDSLFKVGINPIMKSMKVSLEKSLPNLEVKEYESSLNEHTIYYISVTGDRKQQND